MEAGGVEIAVAVMPVSVSLMAVSLMAVFFVAVALVTLLFVALLSMLVAVLLGQDGAGRAEGQDQKKWNQELQGRAGRTKTFHGKISYSRRGRLETGNRALD